MSIYFAGSQFLSTVAKALTLWYGAHLIGARHADVRSAHRLPAVPRPVLLAAAAAVGGVRPVDPGPHLARPPRRAAGHAVVDARARRPGRSRPSGSATSPSKACASPTRRARPRRCAASTCTSPPASAWPSSAPPAPASRRSSSSSPASTTRPPGGCWSTATTCATSTCTPSAASSATCRRSRSCSPARSAPTSPTAGPRRPTSRSSGRPAPSAPTTSCASMPDGYLTPVAETGRSLSAGQRQLLCLARAQLVDPTHPHPRRGDVEPRPGHRGRGAAGDEPGVARGARRCSSPTACRRPATRRASSSSRRAASSRTAATTSWSPPAGATPSCGTPSTAPRRLPDGRSRSPASDASVRSPGCRR